MKNLYYVLIALACIMPTVAAADSPSVTSFAASVTTVNSGQAVDFAWILQNAGGYSIILPCASGITYKDQNLALLTCDSRISSTQAVNTTFRVYITNVSGGTRTLSVRLIPKDGAGQDYDAASQTLAVIVNTTQTPITSFTTSATTTVSGQSVNLQWTTQDVGGVNMQIQCVGSVKATSPSYSTGGFVPCDAPTFPSDLSPSGSVTLSFKNSSTDALPVTVRLLPSITPGLYDGTHGSSLILTVVSDVLPDPVVTFFDASSTIVDPGQEIPFSWTSSNAVKTNMQITCGSGVTVALAQSTTTPLACGGYAFSPDLNASSALKLVFQNSTTLPGLVTMTLVPAKQAGQYDATRSKNITITVRPPGAPVIAPVSAPSVPVSLPPSVPPVSSPPPPVVKNKFIFTRTLQRGSKNADVTKLQEFLKNYPAIYPEGIINGSFGPATERAVQRFQIKYSLARKGIVGYGMVGQKTRAQLNALQ